MLSTRTPPRGVENPAASVGRRLGKCDPPTTHGLTAGLADTSDNDRTTGGPTTFCLDPAAAIGALPSGRRRRPGPWPVGVGQLVAAGMTCQLGDSTGVLVYEF